MGKDTSKLLEQRISNISKYSETSTGVTRLFATKEHLGAIELIREWMRDAGMESYIDDIGNVIGSYKSDNPSAKSVIIGSHQDSVREGGKYDGILGILIPIMAVGKLHEQGIKLPFNVEVIAFGDEEGARFTTSFLSSRAVTGALDMGTLDNKDRDGISLREAIASMGLNPDNVPNAKKDMDNVLCYLESHIEQGPLLQSKNLPLGIVGAINSISIVQFTVTGVAGHSGTVPMELRRDPMVATAHLLVAINEIARRTEKITATVGVISTKPSAVNVIPSHVEFSLDLRHPNGEIREGVLNEIIEEGKALAEKFGVKISQGKKIGADAAICDDDIIDLLKNAFLEEGITPFMLNSGAGHDAQSFANLTKIGMIFIRCKDGVSHSPLEAIKYDDAAIATNVVAKFLTNMREQTWITH